MLFALGIYTGLRLGDCATLKWGEIDLAKNIIRRIPNKTAKKQEPVRIPMHAVLRSMIDELPPAKRSGYLLPQIAADYKRHVSYVTNPIQEHFKKCGIKTEAEEKSNRMKTAVEVGFHSLRHTFVSLCREANAPLSVVEAIVGHSNPAMTRHYTHVSEQAAGQAVAALPSVMTDAPALPASNPRTDLQAKVQEWAARLTPRNAKTIQEEMLKFVASPS